MAEKQNKGAGAFVRPGPDHLWLHMLQSTIYHGAQQSSDVVQQKLAAMLRGIQKYQTCGMLPIDRPVDIVWEQGASRLLCLGKDASREPILLIPSLINGWEIFDLLPDEQSFARTLGQAGHAVYILDWGDLAEENRHMTMDDLLCDRLPAAVAHLRTVHNARVMAFGYCMGGLLMAGAMPFMQGDVAGAVYLATPWDFHAGAPLMTNLVTRWIPDLEPIVKTASVVPNVHVQALFAQVDPDLAMSKYARFAGEELKSIAARRFVAVEDWLRSGRDLPGAVAMTCLNDWYVQNKTARGVWRVGGRDITPDVLRSVPSLVVAPTRDRLVEVQTAIALHAQLGEACAELLTPDLGHIGLMASERAQDGVWRDILGWMATF
jgi:polyhydroxyalkanoate synthase